MRVILQGVIMGAVLAFVVLGLHHFWQLAMH